MSELSRADILSLDEFRAVRQRQLAEVLATQAVRRIAVGEHLTLLFENRTTMRWQIHEMCRVEGLQGAAIDHELQTYNALMPRKDELSATLLVEYEDAEERARELRRLVGLDQHLALDLDGLGPIRGRFDHEQFNDERISAVQFVRFAVPHEVQLGLADLDRGARIFADHPVYNATVDLSRATRGALLDDLAQAAR